MHTLSILLIGCNGQLGWELRRTLSTLGTLTCLDYPQIDLSDTSSLPGVLDRLRFDLLVNASAYTAVDKAEAEPEKALAINGTAPGWMAAAANKNHAPIIHFSTDYVFDGTSTSPYVESDPVNPINAYGRTKLEGEVQVQQNSDACMILRTAWVYSLRRPSFVTKILEWSRLHETLRVVDDQVGNPTWCRVLAEATAQVVTAGKKDLYSFFQLHKGTYHLAGSGSSSRFEFAQKILAFEPNKDGRKCMQILPAKTAEFPSPAARPAYSALDCTRFEKEFGLRLPEWPDALAMALDLG